MLSDVGSEIKKLMKDREQKEPDFWSGVAEEIREIEWPAFGKVLSTTGVVIGVIAGSSVVLLTVNAVLAELSDRVFAGKVYKISLVNYEDKGSFNLFIFQCFFPFFL